MQTIIFAQLSLESTQTFKSIALEGNDEIFWGLVTAIDASTEWKPEAVSTRSHLKYVLIAQRWRSTRDQIISHWPKDIHSATSERVEDVSLENVFAIQSTSTKLWNVWKDLLQPFYQKQSHEKENYDPCWLNENVSKVKTQIIEPLKQMLEAQFPQYMACIKHQVGGTNIFRYYLRAITDMRRLLLSFQDNCLILQKAMMFYQWVTSHREFGQKRFCFSRKITAIRNNLYQANIKNNKNADVTDKSNDVHLNQNEIGPLFHNQPKSLASESSEDEKKEELSIYQETIYSPWLSSLTLQTRELAMMHLEQTEMEVLGFKLDEMVDPDFDSMPIDDPATKTGINRNFFGKRAQELIDINKFWIKYPNATRYHTPFSLQRAKDRHQEVKNMMRREVEIRTRMKIDSKFAQTVKSTPLHRRV